MRKRNYLGRRNFIIGWFNVPIIAAVADFKAQIFNLKTKIDMNTNNVLKNVTPTFGNTLLPAVFFWLERHDWGKWEHVMYVEDFRAGIKNYEILRRECKCTGLTQYRRVYVKSCVHGLTSKLSAWWSQKFYYRMA